MQLLQPHSSLSGDGAGLETGVSSQCLQHSQVAQELTALDVACVSHARQRSGQVNRLTIKSATNSGFFIRRKDSTQKSMPQHKHYSLRTTVGTIIKIVPERRVKLALIVDFQRLFLGFATNHEFQLF